MGRRDAPPLPWGEVERRRRRRPGEGGALSGQVAPLTPFLSPWERGPALVALAIALSIAPASAQPLISYQIVSDAIPLPLTAQPGDPERGRAIVVDRTRGLCVLCHAGPFGDARFQGNLSPDLGGAGGRWSPGQLRLRMVDARQLNRATIMPSYYALDGLARVGAAWQGRTILTAQEIEDVVAYLATLKE